MKYTLKLLTINYCDFFNLHTHISIKLIIHTFTLIYTRIFRLAAMRPQFKLDDCISNECTQYRVAFGASTLALTPAPRHVASPPLALGWPRRTIFVERCGFPAIHFVFFFVAFFRILVQSVWFFVLNKICVGADWILCEFCIWW